MNQADRKREIRTSLETARDRTLWLLGQVPEEFLKRRVHTFYSPIGWHFGHIGRTEEYWVVGAALKRPLLDDRLSFLFADLPENPKDERVHLPSREEIEEYMAATRARVLAALDEADLASDDPFLADGYGWEFALQHECQHQETIAEMLALIHRHMTPTDVEVTFPDWRAWVEPRMVPVPGGVFCMGSDDRHGYDNEKVAHSVRVEPFELARFPVTAYQWSQFVEDGGYRRRSLWSEEGWSWKESEPAELPEYWRQIDGRYAIVSSVGLRAVHPDEPVSCVSWHEAEAYCRWVGARLPTEAEWEFSAAFDPADGSSRHFPWGDQPADSDHASFGLHSWFASPVGQHPAGASALGIQDMAGGVWEWTSTPFLPYPGFEAFPYAGYSKDHMRGEHRVCRGGSWATAAPILRCTFRNWYVRTYRQGFLGLRIAG